jgi:hypothetical protein
MLRALAAFRLRNDDIFHRICDPAEAAGRARLLLIGNQGEDTVCFESPSVLVEETGRSPTGKMAARNCHLTRWAMPGRRSFALWRQDNRPSSMSRTLFEAQKTHRSRAQ